MGKRGAWTTMLLLAASAGLTACDGRPEAAPTAGGRTPPNLVLVTADTLRADHVSSYGYPRGTTPHLDALAAEGALFETAYAVSSTTLPSHATLFSGLYPEEHAVRKNGEVFPSDVPALAPRLREAGYETAAFVSSFVLERRFGLARGFDVYDDDFRGAEHDSPIRRWEGHTLEAPYDRRGNETTDRVLEWLEGVDRDEPFFLWVHYFDPHSPYAPPPRWRERFLETMDPRDPQHTVDLYDGEVRAFDEELGRLVEAVDDHVPPEDTLWVVTSDHGEGLWDHGYLEHGVFLYESMVRVPLVLRWTGRIPAGLRTAWPTHHVDLLPTLAGLTGLDLADSAPRGLDLQPLLSGDGPPEAMRSVFLQRRIYEPGFRHHVRVAGPKHSVRHGPWKLIVSPGEIGFELFHLERDPGETQNLAGMRSDVVRRLHGILKSWHDSQKVRAPADSIVDEEVRRRLEALGYVD